jgi:OFA family oxalate/formate antiporter-like MFS transporter
MRHKGWIVTFSGLSLNLALGILYAWSMFSKQLTETVAQGGYGWSRTMATLPYTLAIASFAVSMIPAGRLQDTLGPRIVASAGALLCSVGLLISSLGSPASALPIILGFGVLSGMGFGLGYAAATPAAVKWFPAHKKGLITGIVVAGFGIAPVYIAPLSKWLLSGFGINRSFQVLGALFAVVAGVAAQFMRNPPPGFAANAAPASPSLTQDHSKDLTWNVVLRRPVFYSLFLQYACAATAGLMVIGHIAKIVATQSGNTIQSGFVFVAVLAIFNALGRIIAGLVSDIIGRVTAMAMVFTMQCLVMFSFQHFTNMVSLLVGTALVGFNYGACLSLFPATAADLWGTKHLGVNYGILFLAWGVGGVFGPLLAGAAADASGTYASAYHIAAGMLALASFLAMANHVSLDYRATEQQLVITVRKKK